MAEIVLGIITKNSHKNLGITYLNALIGSLQVPYNSVIIVDSGEDDTLKVTSDFCHKRNKSFIPLKGEGMNRAKARQAVIDHFLNCFREKWLMFLDDDCVLKPNFFTEAERYMVDPNIGLIWGLDDVEGTRFAKFLKYRGFNPKEYSLKAFKVRGGTHDTLLRREALEGIRIPSYLQVFEDKYIKNYVEQMGYKTVIVYDGCWHLMDYHMIKDAVEYYRTYGSIIIHRIVGNGY
ncbi:MAG: glycosyltransferase family 2 protein [Nitrososphaeria archaeon]